MKPTNNPNKIPCVYMRGGTSKGPFFKLDDLPRDESERNQLLLAIMGSPHPLQIDGIGGGHPQTSKVAMVSRSERADADVDYLFAQVFVDQAVVDTSPNCGNILSAVGPFAIEEGLCEAKDGHTTVRIYNRNTDSIIHSVVHTPQAQVSYAGQTYIDGVNTSSAPIELHFLNAAGSKTGKLLPTGKACEEINGITVSLIDYSVPMLLIGAQSLGLVGDESPASIDENTDLFRRIEAIRLEAGLRMGLGDVSEKVIPRVAILSPARHQGTLTSRYLTPHRCHHSHAITGAMCLAVSCYLEGTVTTQAIGSVLQKPHTVEIEHPSGHVDLDVCFTPGVNTFQTIEDIASIAVIRTARRLFEGWVCVPA